MYPFAVVGGTAAYSMARRSTTVSVGCLYVGPLASVFQEGTACFAKPKLTETICHPSSGTRDALRIDHFSATSVLSAGQSSVLRSSPNSVSHIHLHTWLGLWMARAITPSWTQCCPKNAEMVAITSVATSTDLHRPLNSC